jgi:hypothetical protein
MGAGAAVGAVLTLLVFCCKVRFGMMCHGKTRKTYEPVTEEKKNN